MEGRTAPGLEGYAGNTKVSGYGAEIALRATLYQAQKTTLYQGLRLHGAKSGEPVQGVPSADVSLNRTAPSNSKTEFRIFFLKIKRKRLKKYIASGSCTDQSHPRVALQGQSNPTQAYPVVQLFKPSEGPSVYINTQIYKLLVENKNSVFVLYLNV